MKILTAAILIFCMSIDQKATVQGGLFDVFKGKDKTQDEASGDGSGGFSGELSGNLKLPGNILSECSVEGNINGNIGASTSGGMQGGVNVEANLPSCDCVRKFDTQGSVGGEGSTGSEGFGVSGGASFSGSLAIPGVNCYEPESPEQEIKESTEAPEELEESEELTEAPEESEEESEQCYIVDMDVQVVKLPIFMDVLNKPMDKNNAFKINGADVKVDDKFIYESKSDEMTNACEDLYPEGSFQANIWHMFNLAILKGKGCPVEQGSINTFPKKLDDMQLKINKRLKPGDYTAHLDLSAPNGTWAAGIYFYFMLDSPSECREEEEPQEPMEPVDDVSNSNCYKVDIKRNILLVPDNNFLSAPQIGGDVTAEFFQTMDMQNALQFYRADISVNTKSIYDSKPEQKMKNACDDSYPKGSFEANIWKIFNLSIMNGQECPLEKGKDHTFIGILKKTELNFNDPLEYGNYTVHMDFDTPQGDWALGLYYDFVVDENSMCTRS